MQQCSEISDAPVMKSAIPVRGRTEMQRDQPDQVRRMSMAKRGCFFGEDMVAILAAGADCQSRSTMTVAHRCRRYTATAVTYVDILRFPGSALVDIVKHNQFPHTKKLIIAHAHSMLGTSPGELPISVGGTDVKSKGCSTAVEIAGGSGAVHCSDIEHSRIAASGSDAEA